MDRIAADARRRRRRRRRTRARMGRRLHRFLLRSNSSTTPRERTPAFSLAPASEVRRCAPARYRPSYPSDSRTTPVLGRLLGYAVAHESPFPVALRPRRSRVCWVARRRRGGKIWRDGPAGGEESGIHSRHALRAESPGCVRSGGEEATGPAPGRGRGARRATRRCRGPDGRGGRGRRRGNRDGDPADANGGVTAGPGRRAARGDGRQQEEYAATARCAATPQRDAAWRRCVRTAEILPREYLRVFSPRSSRALGAAPTSTPPRRETPSTRRVPEDSRRFGGCGACVAVFPEEQPRRSNSSRSRACPWVVSRRCAAWRGRVCSTSCASRRAPRATAKTEPRAETKARTPPPTSATCFNTLRLPEYPTYDVLEQQVTTALVTRRGGVRVRMRRTEVGSSGRSSTRERRMRPRRGASPRARAQSIPIESYPREYSCVCVV